MWNQKPRCCVTILSFMVLMASGSATLGQGEPTESDTGPSEALIAACASLTRLQCMSSFGCMLELIEPSDGTYDYRCRPNEGPCEVGYPQSSGEIACVGERVGCTFTPGQCYCRCQGYGTIAAGDHDSPGCDCDCAGGPPPACTGEEISLTGEDVTFFEYRHDLTAPDICPEATYLGQGRLLGYALTFSGHSDEWAGATAGLRVVRGEGFFPGLFYGLPDTCLSALDEYEAARGYVRQEHFITRMDSAVIAPAWLYAQAEQSHDAPPSERYLEILRNAWFEQGWDTQALERAAGRR